MLLETKIPAAPIALFDSGVGGLSVLRELRQQLPGEDVIFLADQAHVPYGPRSMGEVRRFSEGITRFLLEQGAKLIVVACNTASAAALHHLRITFPGVNIVGMEPAVKPAVEQTKTGVVGVLATPVTFQGELYASLVDEYAQGVRVLQDTCVGLVGEIEAGRVDGQAAREILEGALHSMLAEGVDAVVLGCTHYPFVSPLIETIAGDGVRVIDPASGVVRHVGRLLEQHGLASAKPAGGRTRYLTTGDAAAMETQLEGLLGVSGEVAQVRWGRELSLGEG
ncbi:MAG: glutamate racemase [Anaerolineae bacterium]|nr:glutamate racemase [Anaerolineae bacterium]